MEHIHLVNRSFQYPLIIYRAILLYAQIRIIHDKEEGRAY